MGITRKNRERKVVLVVGGANADKDALRIELAAEGLIVIEVEPNAAMGCANQLCPMSVIIDSSIGVSCMLDLCAQLTSSLLPDDVPVVLVLDACAGDLRAASFKAGAGDFVLKPYRAKEVLWRIASCTERSSGTAAEPAYLGGEQFAHHVDVLYNDSVVGYYSLDPDGVIVRANDTALRWIGCNRKQIVGRTRFIDMISERSRALLTKHQVDALQAGWLLKLHEMEIELIGAGGATVPVLVNAAAQDEREVLTHFTLLNMTQHRRDSERVRYLSLHDTLTGLPNRTLFEDHLRRDIAHARRDRRRVAVMFIDLDHFKQVNDVLGHRHGDQLIREAAERLQSCLRDVDCIARVGGDEFFVSLPGLSDEHGAGVVAAAMLQSLVLSFDVAGHECYASGSIGISMFPEDGENGLALMRAADTAMYQAKELGRNNFQYYSQQHNDRLVQRYSIESRLHRAIKDEEFFLEFQPKYDLGRGELVGAEALIRWRPGGAELVSPGQFIPIAEQSGLIIPIGEWVLEKACAVNKYWQVAGYPPIVMAVNVSTVQFKARDLFDQVLRTLRHSELDPHFLELEVTESTLMHDYHHAVAMLSSLKSLGVQLSIDDFGTGYSSLAYLKHFPIDTLKIDRSFIADLEVGSASATIVGAVIKMAQSLQRRVVAEGVETDGQLQQLRLLHCHEAQGFYLGRPMSAAEFEAKAFHSCAAHLTYTE